jgi:hypothetical protein
MSSFAEQQEEARKLFALLEGKVFPDYAAAAYALRAEYDRIHQNGGNFGRLLALGAGASFFDDAPGGRIVINTHKVIQVN